MSFWSTKPLVNLGLQSPKICNHCGHYVMAEAVNQSGPQNVPPLRHFFIVNIECTFWACLSIWRRYSWSRRARRRINFHWSAFSADISSETFKFVGNGCKFSLLPPSTSPIPRSGLAQELARRLWCRLWMALYPIGCLVLMCPCSAGKQGMDEPRGVEGEGYLGIIVTRMSEALFWSRNLRSEDFLGVRNFAVTILG